MVSTSDPQAVLINFSGVQSSCSGMDLHIVSEMGAERQSVLGSALGGVVSYIRSLDKLSQSNVSRHGAEIANRVKLHLRASETILHQHVPCRQVLKSAKELRNLYAVVAL